MLSWHGLISLSMPAVSQSSSRLVLMPSIPIGSAYSLAYVPLLQRLMLQRRQTVFYTPDTLGLQVGDQITGELSCAPNARNPRDLDISISYSVPNDVQPTTVQYKMCVIRFCSPATPDPIAVCEH